MCVLLQADLLASFDTCQRKRSSSHYSLWRGVLALLIFSLLLSLYLLDVCKTICSIILGA